MTAVYKPPVSHFWFCPNQFMFILVHTHYNYYSFICTQELTSGGSEHMAGTDHVSGAPAINHVLVSV